MRYRSGGTFECGGLTVRAPYGALRGSCLPDCISPDEAMITGLGK